MSSRAAERKVRYLKLIALFKIGKGLLLVGVGISALFLNAQFGWSEWLSDWIDDELLLAHSKATRFLLNALQQWLAGGHLQATGILALFYAAVLFTEGIGVYFQQRWAELLMIVATSALIPLEIRHVWHHPSLTGFAILIVNCIIVLFLYRVLKREKHRSLPPAKPEVAGVH